jgi:membrane protease subunit HflC
MKFSSWMSAIVAALLLVASSMYVIPEGQTALVLNLGKVVRADLEPGLHFKLPLVESLRRFDRRLQVLAAPAERYLTSERKDVSVDFFAIGGSRTCARSTAPPAVTRMLRPRAWRRSSRTRCATRSTRAPCSKLVSGDRADVIGKQLENINSAPGTWACASSTCASSRSTCPPTAG